MAIQKVSVTRIPDTITGKKAIVDGIQRASTFSIKSEIGNKDGDVYAINKEIASLVAGDKPVTVLKYASEFLGGYLEQDADEGADGTATVEKWDDVAGSNQTAISAAATVNAGAAAIVTLAATSDGSQYVAAGYKINLAIATVDGTPSGRITLYFRKVETAGDVSAGAVLYDCTFLGGYWEQDGDEGTNGTLLIEKWDDAAGSSQTSISSSLAIDAGAASLEAITALTTSAATLAAGEKVNLKLATFTYGPTGRVTLFFKTVDDPTT